MLYIVMLLSLISGALMGFFFAGILFINKKEERVWEYLRCQNCFSEDKISEEMRTECKVPPDNCGAGSGLQPEPNVYRTPMCHRNEGLKSEKSIN